MIRNGEAARQPLSVSSNTRCEDMNVIADRLRTEYGNAAFRKHFPYRNTRSVENERQPYVDKLRSIENRWNASCASANLRPIYIADWTDEPADETLELIEFITSLANSTVVAGFLPQFQQLENMKCKSSCGSCIKGKVGRPRCCGKRASINIDTRTQQFAWCEEGQRGSRPIALHFECTFDCGCGDECENRDVQKGRKVSLCVFREPGAGWGVRTVRSMEAGDFVTEYCGEVKLGVPEAGKRYEFEMENHVRDPDTGEVLYEPLVISAADKGNEARFFNHSCTPNMHADATVIERYGIFYHHISFFTGRKIDAGEELKFDYFQHRKRASSETRRMFESCRCGAANCRFRASSASVKDVAPKRKRVVLLSSDDSDEEDTRRE